MGAWWVDCEGKPFGPFDDTRQAVQGAIKLARLFGDPERQALVMVPDDTGRYQVAWDGGKPATSLAPEPAGEAA
jgi:hypothetical protein